MKENNGSTNYDRYIMNPGGLFHRWPRYRIYVHNFHTNRWEEFGTARTIDEAFDHACLAVGFSKIHDTIEIEDPAGFSIWNSEGFSQGEGKRLPSANKINWHEDAYELETKLAPEERRRSEDDDLDAPYVAPDGSC